MLTVADVETLIAAALAEERGVVIPIIRDVFGIARPEARACQVRTGRTRPLASSIIAKLDRPSACRSWP